MAYHASRADIQKSDPQAPQKELKVILPLGLYVKLHSMKLLTGKTIGMAVSEALDAYFAEPLPTPIPQAANH